MYVIHGVPTPGSMMWMWVSKETGSPWTTMKDNARKFKTYEGAVRAMNRLKATARHWANVGSACEVYAIECDHDWVDDSHAGLDSGNIDLTCRKCGKTCYANLY
jgi:hypothetical protein